MSTEEHEVRYEGWRRRGARPAGEAGGLTRLAGPLPEQELQEALKGLAPEEITGPGGLLTQRGLDHDPPAALRWPRCRQGFPLGNRQMAANSLAGFRCLGSLTGMRDYRDAHDADQRAKAVGSAVTPYGSDAQLLTAEQIAARLVVPVTWVKKSARAGRIPSVPVGRYRL